MAEFTSGERRGLMVLIAILACLTLVLLFRQILTSREAEAAADDAYMRIVNVADSVSVTKQAPPDSAAVRMRNGRKTVRSKLRKTSAPPPPPRNPLDEKVN